jgi:hypothetical protein
VDDRKATYERFRTEIAGLPAAPDASNRHLLWMSESLLAVARNELHCVELFIVSEHPLRASIGVVEDLLAHQVWTSSQGDFSAARVVLPRGEHFDQLAALLCVELIDSGLGEDGQEAFAAVEPLLALALSRDMVGDPVLNGLIGELSLLRRLLRQVAAPSRADVLAAWAGSTPSSRDFQLGSVGVEVKTTQSTVSTHHVSGFHQVERGLSNGGVPETDLFVLSLGIEWLEAGAGGTSLPELVDSVLSVTPGHEAQESLLARIKQYGGDITIGYDHRRDRSKGRYAGRFHFRFERLYDMADDRIEVLRREDVNGLKNLDPESVEFRVLLETKIRGDLNPIAGWNALVPYVLAKAGFPGQDKPEGPGRFAADS